MIGSLWVLAQQRGTDVEVVTYTPSPQMMLLGSLVGVAISAIICYLLYNALRAIPPEYRRMEPGLVWLLLIPLFNFVWNFFVFPRVAESYARYFHAHGRPDVGNAGRGLGLAYAICAVCSLIPCLGVLSGLAALVLLVLYLVRIYGLKAQLGQAGGGYPPAGPMAPPPPPAPGF